VKPAVIACAALLAAATSLGAQQQPLHVLQSHGYVEALLADQGWRQAVVGRELPAGAVVASWLKAGATLGYRDGTLTVGPLTHLTVVDADAERLQLSLEAGAVELQSAGTVIEIRFRGLLVRIEKGRALISDGVLTVKEGSCELRGAAGRDPMKLAVGDSLDLVARAGGAVFR
jgi:hypothetical protein